MRKGLTINVSQSIANMNSIELNDIERAYKFSQSNPNQTCQIKRLDPQQPDISSFTTKNESSLESHTASYTKLPTVCAKHNSNAQVAFRPTKVNIKLDAQVLGTSNFKYNMIGSIILIALVLVLIYTRQVQHQ